MIVVDQPDAVDGCAGRPSNSRNSRRVRRSPLQLLKSFEQLRWQAHATFMTDESGAVGIARQAPISGSYEGAAAMGLIWSAERVSPPSPPFPDDWVLQPSVIHFEAVGPNDQRAELAITRRSAGPGVTRRVIRVDVGRAYCFCRRGGPTSLGSHLMAAAGAWMSIPAPCLRRARLRCVQSCVFRRARPATRSRQYSARIFRKRNPLDAGAALAARRFSGRLGPSRGGELALPLGATFPDINAVSAWVPSGDTCSGRSALPSRAIRGHRRRGRGVASRRPICKRTTAASNRCRRSRPDSPRHTRRSISGTFAINAPSNAPRIPVENIRGPILLVSGTDDQSGRHRLSPTSRCAVWNRMVSNFHSGT